MARLIIWWMLIEPNHNLDGNEMGEKNEKKGKHSMPRSLKRSR